MSTNGTIKRRCAKKFVPTEDQRETVVGLKSIGATSERIASILKISVDTLDKHFKQELESGLQTVLGQIASNLFRQALDGDTTAAIFILKTRAKWSEKIEIDRLDQPGTLVIHTSGRSPDDYTDEELVAIIEAGREKPPAIK